MEIDEPRAGREGLPSEDGTASADSLAPGAVANDDAWADEKLKSVLESLLFVAGEPVSLTQLANALEEVPRERIRKSLNEMGAAYASGRRGFLLSEIAGGYQLRTPGEHAAYVRRLLSAKPPRLSRPVLETLAIVAYRQPITRPEVEQLRGVDSGGVLETLVERNLIRIAGRKDAPGRPIVYTTTPDFLELFSLKDLESLPDLEEFRELEGLREPGESSQAALGAELPGSISQSDEELTSASRGSAESSIDRLTAPAAEVATEPAADTPPELGMQTNPADSAKSNKDQ